MGDSNKNIDLIIPVYNPPEGWVVGIEKNVNELKQRLNCAISVIVVCDGGLDLISTESIDNLRSSVPGLVVLQYAENRGKGFALRHGIQHSTNELIIYTDVDFPYTTDSFIKIHESLNIGNPIAIGTRSSSYYHHVPWLRRVISKMLRRMIRAVIRIPVNDTQCGLKGFNQNGKSVFLSTRIDRFLFDLEFVKLASKNNVSIDPVSVELKPGVTFSKTRIAILIRESFNFMRLLFR